MMTPMRASSSTCLANRGFDVNNNTVMDAFVGTALVDLEKSRSASGETQREELYRVYLSRGDYGATDREIEEQHGFNYSAICSLRKHLMAVGAVVVTGNKRLTSKGKPADVYVGIAGIDLNQTPPRDRHSEIESNLIRLVRRVSDEKPVDERVRLAEMLEKYLGGGMTLEDIGLMLEAP